MSANEEGREAERERGDAPPAVASAPADTAAANRADFTVVLLRDSGRRDAEGAAPSLPCLPA